MSTATQPTLTKPAFEHHPDGFGITNPRPRLSWRFIDSGCVARDWVQTEYEIELVFDHIREPQLFRVKSEQSILVPWPTEALRSRQRARARVRCWGKGSHADEGDGLHYTPTPWSPAATVETALLSRDDWSVSFITSARRLSDVDGPLQPLRFRHQFNLPKSEAAYTSARLYITALGVFKAYLNGHALSDECMAPGWTSYNKRLTYRVLDVGGHLSTSGDNVLAIEAGEGWYATRLGFRGGTRFLYGGRDIAVMAQLEVTSAAGRIRTLGTDGSWVTTGSAIIASELYNGEIYDMRRERVGWETATEIADPDGIDWTPAKTIPWPSETRLLTTNSPPVRVIETREPQAIVRSATGKLIVDFGQNLVGNVRIKSVVLARDARLTLRHAEVLEHGELGTRPLNNARCEDVLIGDGGPTPPDWTPKFTFHGFRYVQVDGWPGSEEELTQSLSALVIHSDMRRRGYFSCSNESLNKLHANVVWSMRGNFLSIPSDCPQRDERLGWTGDIQIFCPTASYLYDTVGFLDNWLQDLSAEQLEDGRGGVPGLVCPDVPLPTWPRILPQAVWHDATVLVPYTLYNFSSDRALLERQFESMQAWLEQGVDRGDDGLWDFYRWQLGDWLDPNAPPQSPALALTDKVLVADAYLVHVTGVFATICSLLGKSDLAAKYKSDAATLKAFFQEKYISPAGNIMSNTQTAIALAVQFGLYANTRQLSTAARSLSKLVRSGRFHIATGFAGTPAIAPALEATCQPQLAYRLLLEPSCPSWLYPVTQGATTMWERWDSMLPNGSINPGQMTSFNHYALGAVADWMHSAIGGLAPLDAGWKRVRVRPVPGGNLTSCEVQFDGPYGLVKCSWRILSKVEGDEKTGPEAEAAGDGQSRAQRFEMELVVPPNSSALVTLPCDLRLDVQTEGGEPHQVVGSGVHHFACDFVAGEWPPKALLPPNVKYAPEMDNVAT
ncbi:related to alfa-L-rhamnosidase [Cephalotrichum gorgonifer]|uniref:alpha-L-rhamnosidase n=1 Tax=Cephalotrichum gorgonifer TaxID=2041049 RepID=A0AAE8SU35_9PEZI|nr:related to alfa-L-rhamnosidase [Cephalotrichum gorgonifer]